METTKRITVNKNDEPTLVAEKLIDTEAETIIFTIPKFSKFGQAATNFKLIKREAEVLKKKIVIESIDDDVINLAKRAGLDTINPFFGKAKRMISDISVIKRTKKKEDSTGAQEHKVIYVQEVPKTDTVQVEATIKVESLKPVKPKRNLRVKLSFGRFFSKRAAIIVGSAIILAGLAYLGLGILPKANIQVVMKKEQWKFENNLTVDASTVGTLDAKANKIPGQVFTQKGNLSLKFPASGRKYIEQKSTGKIIIYNAFSSQPQQLVASTRFQTPDGKVFRLQSTVPVPEAKIVDGKIVPSSITVSIIADKAGAEYNLGPVARLSIPGFAGTPKYDAFYGEIKDATTGGFVGEAKVPTEKDLTSAKAQAIQSLESSLRTLLVANITAEFKTVAEAYRFSVSKQTVENMVNDKGEFSVFTEGQLSNLAFRESDIENLFAQKIKNQYSGNYQITEKSLTYGVPKLDTQTVARMTLPVNYFAQLIHVVSVEDLIRAVKGKAGADLNQAISSIKGVTGGKVSFWPFYVRTVPAKDSRINITIQ